MRRELTEGEIRRARLGRLRGHLGMYAALGVKRTRRKCAICGAQAEWCVVWDEGEKTTFVTFFCEGCRVEAEAEKSQQDAGAPGRAHEQTRS